MGEGPRCSLRAIPSMLHHRAEAWCAGTGISRTQVCAGLRELSVTLTSNAPPACCVCESLLQGPENTILSSLRWGGAISECRSRLQAGDGQFRSELKERGRTRRATARGGAAAGDHNGHRRGGRNAGGERETAGEEGPGQPAPMTLAGQGGAGPAATAGRVRVAQQHRPGARRRQRRR